MTTQHKHSAEPLADKIIERIDQEQVVPKPRWQFTLLNQIFWALWGVSLLFAMVAMGAMIFALANAGWEFHAVTHDSFLSYLIDVLPFFWITVIVLMLFFAYETVKRTKWGYRYPFSTTVGFAVIGIVLGGTVLFASGLSEDVEREFGRRIPLYHPMVEYQQHIWIDPARGLLAGEIVETESEYATFTIRTFAGDAWVVNGDDLRVRDREYLTAHRLVRLVGVPIERDGSSTFHACFIFPWDVRGSLSPALNRRGLPAPPRPADDPSVRKFVGERSTLCKGVRPYDVLKSMRRDESSP